MLFDNLTVPEQSSPLCISAASSTSGSHKKLQLKKVRANIRALPAQSMCLLPNLLLTELLPICDGYNFTQLNFSPWLKINLYWVSPPKIRHATDLLKFYQLPAMKDNCATTDPNSEGSQLSTLVSQNG